jgi:hypothetical protein
MAQNVYTQPIGELTAVVSRILTAIEGGGGEMNLRDLQRRLVDLVVSIKPNPGVTAAAEDLFAAAAAMVKDGVLHSQPEARKRRLLRDARRRFEERVVGAEQVVESLYDIRANKSVPLAA